MSTFNRLLLMSSDSMFPTFEFSALWLDIQGDAVLTLSLGSAYKIELTVINTSWNFLLYLIIDFKKKFERFDEFRNMIKYLNRHHIGCKRWQETVHYIWQKCETLHFGGRFCNSLIICEQTNKAFALQLCNYW